MIDKVAQPKWEKEAIKHMMSGHSSKANKIVKSVRSGVTGENSTLRMSDVLSSKHSTPGKDLANKMTLGDERRRLAKTKPFVKKAENKDNKKSAVDYVVNVGNKSSKIRRIISGGKSIKEYFNS